jgi:hypothetical protein
MIEIFRFSSSLARARAGQTVFANDETESKMHTAGQAPTSQEAVGFTKDQHHKQSNRFGNCLRAPIRSVRRKGFATHELHTSLSLLPTCGSETWRKNLRLDTRKEASVCI